MPPGGCRLIGTHEVAVRRRRGPRVQRPASHDGRPPFHVNNVRFVALDAAGAELDAHTYFSVGGGFVVDEHMAAGGEAARAGVPDADDLPYPFHSARRARWRSPSARVARSPSSSAATSATWRTDAEIDEGLLRIWRAMRECVARGVRHGRRAARAAARPAAGEGAPRAAGGARGPGGPPDPLAAMDWVNLWAMAVNEENAAGGRVVTAPTNGAAGIVPAVLHYYTRFIPGADDAGVIEFLLTATAIGILFKENASISGAEVGCQGEVGSACSMAAGGLAAVLGGTPAKVENAAEIGIEHNLGLTCDPVGGLVQIPCIERNALAGGQGDQRGADGAGRRRDPPREPRRGDQDHARHRRRHDDQVQGDVAGRARPQRDRVLTSRRAAGEGDDRAQRGART